MRPWRRIESRRLQRCKVFDVDEVRFRPPEATDDRAGRPFYVIDAPDWVNVIPLADDGHVLMVRQYRFGIEDFTLEIPGGMCDPGESPLTAARRELIEETGHDARRWSSLGWVHPNPPIQNNRCHTFLAHAPHRIAEPRPDPHERFEQKRVPIDDIPDLILDGRITHALVLAAFTLLRSARDRPDGDVG